jgi:hemoglobin
VRGGVGRKQTDMALMCAGEQTYLRLTRKFPHLRAMIHIKEVVMKKFLIAILSLFAVALTLPLQAAPEKEKSLYERLGGVFAIAAVVDHFSDAVVQNPVVGKNSQNPALREWHTNNLGRLPGLKFMRTLWVCEVTGGPFKFSATKPGKTHLGLEEAHRDLKISPEEFDEVAAELGRSLDFAKVPAREKGEVLAAFAAHKKEVTAGYKTK